ncbi:MAG: pilin [bacterium]|nr:pilin [bacterium]
MLKKRKLLLTGLSLLGMGLPILAQAQGGFLSGISAGCYSAGSCDFCDIGRVITNIFNFLRNDIAFPLAVLMVIYGGVVMIFSAGSSSRVASGRKILMSAVIGFAIVFGASLIINTALTVLSKSQFTISNVFSASGINCVNIGNE